jgi:hypothetical protein
LNKSWPLEAKKKSEELKENGGSHAIRELQRIKCWLADAEFGGLGCTIAGEFSEGSHN